MLLKFIEVCRNQKSEKRIEERKKFIYKNGLKRLRKNFYKENNIEI